MAKLIFLEGISGVSKSTMARSLCKDLQTNGLSAKAYVEFDYTNPIDFYCVAYYPTGEYEMLLTENPENETSIRANTINAGSARLIHYFDEDTPLFEEPLLSVFMEREFCYNPRNPVSLEKYSDAYVAVWKNFAANLADNEIIIFDGSLLHHPLDIKKQLTTAHLNRGQQPPDETELSFWQKRFDYDLFMLKSIEHRSFVIDNQWESVKKEILKAVR